MIKSITKLQHSLSAQAGQLLVLHQNGNVYVVDHNALENLICGPSFAAKPETTQVAQSKTDETREGAIIPMVDEMLVRGFSFHEIVAATGVARKLITKRRVALANQGLLPLKRLLPKSGFNHHWFKSEQALESARARAKRMQAVTKARREAAK
jgi:hypothetical protein